MLPMPPPPPPPPPPPTKAEDWPVANPGTVRKGLLRRIASGQVCGVISRVSGRPCLASPIRPGSPCQKHANPTDKREPLSKAGRMLRALVQDALSPEESRIFDGVFSESPTLETEISLARLKLVKLERDYSEGKLKDETYQKRWINYTDSLRKLIATNQKARLAEETLKQANKDPFSEPDAYDPLAPEDADSDADSDTEGENE